MKTLVIGSSGFLGRRISRQIEGTVVGTFYSNPVRNAIKVDLRDALAVRQCVADIEPDTIVYLAGLTSSEACEDRPSESDLLNRAALCTLTSCSSARIIYVSTDYVFDGIRGGYAESEPPTPVNQYGRSKAAGERLVLAAARSNAVVRVSGLYDSTGTKDFDWKQVPDGFASRDDRFSSPIHVDDVATGIGAIIRSGEGGVFHAAGPERLSRYEVHQMAVLHNSSNSTVLPSAGPHVADGPNLPRDTSLSSRLLTRLGWSARSLATGLARADVEMPPRPHDSGRAVMLDCIGGLLGRRQWPVSNSARGVIALDCETVLDGSTFWADAAHRAGDSPENVQSAVCDLYAPNSRVWHLLGSIRERYRLALVNAGPSATFRIWVRKYGLDRFFDVLLNSEEVGVPKTDTSFYQTAARLCGVRPSDCFAIDDSAPCLAAARAIGMQTLLTIEDTTTTVSTFWPNTWPESLKQWSGDSRP